MKTYSLAYLMDKGRLVFYGALKTTPKSRKIAFYKLSKTFWTAVISGNKGIQLVFKNGDKVLIGTQKPDEATIALARLKNK